MAGYVVFNGHAHSIPDVESPIASRTLFIYGNAAKKSICETANQLKKYNPKILIHSGFEGNPQIADDTSLDWAGVLTSR